MTTLPKDLFESAHHVYCQDQTVGLMKGVQQVHELILKHAKWGEITIKMQDVGLRVIEALRDQGFVVTTEKEIQGDRMDSWTVDVYRISWKSKPVQYEFDNS